MALNVVQAVKPVGRRMRRPSHPFQIRSKPYQIQPFFIAPVIPGETMKNLLMQARVVSDPVKNPLIGWWQEYYFFYVKHRDLNDRDHFTNMMITPNYDLSSLYSAANAKTYHAGGSIDWAQKCLERVTETYFRDEGEAWNAAQLDGLPIAQVANESWLDSVKLGSVQPEGYEPPVDPTEGEVDPAYAAHKQQWEFMRAHKMTMLDYEDYLKSFGINLPKEEVQPHKPELIRYLKDWSYPTNTVNPADGKPSSALSWAIAERADKDRFFKEPGFLFGVTVTRPKVYLSKQTGSAVSLMADAVSWFPAVLREEGYYSLRQVAQGAGPLPSAVDAQGYWVDLRDLLIYGEQFVNFSLADTSAGMVALPTSAMQKKFVSSADVDGLFTNAASNLIRQDGVVALQILGAQVDQT
jgi:hypothetical protein